MVWRGIAARRLLSLTIFLLTMLVVAGTLISVSFSRLTDVSRGSAGALVLLGFVALAAQSAESVRRREPEIALARLRGRRGSRLVLFAVAEPCVVVVAGAVAGAVVGWVATRVVVGAWLPAGTAVSIDRIEWTAIALLTVGALLLVLVVSARIVRAPLNGQLANARRPRRETPAALFLQLVLVLGAVVSVYQAHRASSSRVDWVTLVSPALVGLAGGQLLVWAVLALLAVAVPRAGGGQIGWFLTLRRLLRRADSLAVLRIVVAAGVVVGVATSASLAAQTWRDDRARLQVGGPVSYPVAAGALRAYAAAGAADPQGRWLLPVAAYTSSAEGSGRRVFVDVARWGPVLGDFFAGTPSSGVTGLLAAVRPSPPVQVDVGTEISATAVTSSLAGADGLSLTFEYVDDQGDSALAKLALIPGRGVPAARGLTRFTGRLAGCRAACSVLEIDIDGRTRERHGPSTPLRLVDATFAGQHLLGSGSGVSLVPGQRGLRVERDGSALEVRTAPYFQQDTWVLGSFRARDPQPALSAGDVNADVEHGHPVVEGIDGVPGRVVVAGTAPALPFVGTLGRLVDLGGMLVGSGGSIPDTQAVVLARADTPDSVIAALRATHAVGRPTTYQQLADRLDRTSRAQSTRLYGLVAGIAALIALLSIASALVQQTGERRREAASLRSVGISARAVAGAYHREALVLAAVTFVGTTVAAWIACRALLPVLPLVSGWVYAPPLDAAPHLGVLAAVSLIAGVVTGLVTYLAFRRVGRVSRPGILREDPS